ncbi:MAG TPA: ABC transporter ATP-binding protein [Bacteroidales bacterium]|nr:ABC transporter ATP-binding protein [Bacteroidales bacterium]
MEMNPKLRNIRMTYGELEVFRDLTVSFLSGRINCILGPSGCGKTTLLNIISGTITPEAGDRSDFVKKKMSYVFQDPRLLPWKTVYGNMAFVLKDRLRGEALAARINDHIRRVQLEAFSNYYPSQLSGGMKQRVSLARAFSFDSEMILMDEPFKALDLKLRNMLTRDFLDLWHHDRRTVIFVTHDVDEAVNLGERIIILGTPPEGITSMLDKSEYQDLNSLKHSITSRIS